MNRWDANGNLISVNAPYEEQKWTLFGDSLTDNFGGKNWNPVKVDAGPGDGSGEQWFGYLFASRIGRELRLTIDNRAKSGSVMYNAGPDNGIMKLDAFLAEIAAGTTPCPDYITVAFGTNSAAASIGTMADGPETKTTVYGAMKYYVQKLRELTKTNPHLVFGFVLPPPGDWGSFGPGKDIDGAYKAMKDVLDDPTWMCPYVDMRRAGITVDMLPDGIHIKSERANNLYYHALRGFILTL